MASDARWFWGKNMRALIELMRPHCPCNEAMGVRQFADFVRQKVPFSATVLPEGLSPEVFAHRALRVLSATGRT
jgi:hypothetical protein